MGSCVSVHTGAPDSAVKLGMPFGAKSDSLVMPKTPIKNNLVTAAVDQLCETFDDFNGSKDEIFFDAQPWLDSDSDDDFCTVNDDFTPSRGSNPVHHNFSRGTPQVKKPTSEDGPPGSNSEPSPGGKKRLIGLFRDSIQDNQDAYDMHTPDNQKTASEKIEVKPTILDVTLKSTKGTPYVSGLYSDCSSERTANGEALTEREKLLIEREKPIKSVQCCLPSFISCHRFNKRKKKKTPAVAVNDNS